jgi:hypothetical protein
MNYEFHVGDYVKTRAGFIGYIDGINDLEDDNIAVRVCYSDGDSGYFRVDDLNITNNFLRIGAYDFTKKEKKEIEPLNYNASVDATIKQLSALKNKINELVDAVNKLMDKEDEE